MYVAVKGGEKAIDAAHALQESRRRGDTDLPELSVAQIEQQLNLAVDRGVIGEGKRADLVLAHRKGNHIHIDHVWRQGKRVF
ncbi:carbon-phosphorus lyase complex subunit PhnI [Escherichia coli]|nr:hypothetical protein [Escherichia coli]EEX9520987.1 hypothetical protein [Escherichia coli]EFJ3679892.1 hypothetical protein [Escherichia coli]EFL0637760.1 hypothetical protein [Escherichia coli]EGP2577402.1 hypothetical protein [Escherichia coli]